MEYNEILVPIDYKTALGIQRSKNLNNNISSNGEFGRGIYGFTNLEDARNSVSPQDKQNTYFLSLEILDDSGINVNNNKIFIPNISMLKPKLFYRSETDHEKWRRTYNLMGESKINLLGLIKDELLIFSLNG